MTGWQKLESRIEDSLERILEIGLVNVANSKDKRLRRNVAKQLLAAAILASPLNDDDFTRKALALYAGKTASHYVSKPKRHYSAKPAVKTPEPEKQYHKPAPAVIPVPVAKPKRQYIAKPVVKKAPEPEKQYHTPVLAVTPAPVAKPKMHYEAAPAVKPAPVAKPEPARNYSPPAPRIKHAEKPAELEARVENSSPAAAEKKMTIARIIRNAVFEVYSFVPDNERVQSYRAKYKDVIAKHSIKTGRRQQVANPGSMAYALVELLRQEKDSTIHPRLASVSGKVLSIDDVRVMGKMTYEQMRTCLQDEKFKKALGNVVTSSQGGVKTAGYLLENVEAALGMVTGNAQR